MKKKSLLTMHREYACSLEFLSFVVNITKLKFPSSVFAGRATSEVGSPVAQAGFKLAV